MIPARTLYLPKSNTPEEAETTYDKALRSLVIELGSLFDNTATPVLGENWFFELMSVGHTDDERSKWLSKYDPGFVFGEVLNHPESPLRMMLPTDYGFLFSYKKSRQIRNAWAHNFGEFGLSKLYVDLQHFRNVGLGAGLAVGDALNPVIARIAAILNGTFEELPDAPVSVEVTTNPDPQEAQDAFEREEEERQKALVIQENERKEHKRPRIGGRWIGPKPERALRIQDRLKDIVDRQTSVSIRAELGDVAELKISRWLRPKPLGDFFVDSDGAVLGYIQGEPYLMGYMNNDHDRDVSQIEGFVLKYSYSVENGDVIEEESNQRLSELHGVDTEKLRAVINAAVDPLDEIKITTHGDLFSYTDHGPVKILRVEPKLWFPDQL